MNGLSDLTKEVAGRYLGLPPWEDSARRRQL